MNTVRASVVIPTYQRRESLLRALVSLERQTLASDAYEVIVSVDGSDDGTREAADAVAARHGWQVLWQPNRGRAAARNAGIRAARGALVVMLDDDMEATPGLLDAHLRAHPDGARRAVIGAVPIREETGAPAHVAYIAGKFNRHLDHLTRSGRPLGLRDFYSGNLSVQRTVLDEIGGFDERFTAYGNEDLELSVRLAAARVDFVYEPTAVAWQSYDKSFGALVRDNLAKGRTAVLLSRLHPGAREQLKLGSFASESLPKRLAVHTLLGATRIAPATRELVVSLVDWLGARRWPGVQRLYPTTLDYMYWCGVREAEREPPPARAR